MEVETKAATLAPESQNSKGAISNQNTEPRYLVNKTLISHHSSSKSHQNVNIVAGHRAEG